MLDQLKVDETRERLLHSAMKLFAEKGYLSTSVADILHEADAHSGSLYHFFPTKQDVLTAVLDTYRQGIEPMLIAPAWRGVSDPVERIFALLSAYRRMLVDTGCLYGCPIGSLALELHEPDPPVRQLLAANFDSWVSHVKACLEDARERFPAGTDLRSLAVFVLTVMEGGVMQSRTHRTLEAFDAGVAMLRDYFTHLEKAAKPAKKRRK